MSVVWMFLQYAPWKSHRGFNTCFYECFHCWLQPLITGLAVMWWVDVIICSQDICINSPGSTVLLSICLAKEIGNWTLWHHYGITMASLWYLKLKQLVLFATPNGFLPTRKLRKPFFPSLISLLLFVAFRVPSAMWGICGRQWVSTSTFEIEGVRVLTSIPFLWRMLKVTSSNSPQYPATIDVFQFRKWL